MSCYLTIPLEPRKLTDDPMPAAIAVELLHTESIIHDDIIDGDLVRRDRETFHARYGINPSILSADYVLGIVLDIASQYADLRVGRELSRSVLRMSEGEYCGIHHPVTKFQNKDRRVPGNYLQQDRRPFPDVRENRMR